MWYGAKDNDATTLDSYSGVYVFIIRGAGTVSLNVDVFFFFKQKTAYELLA